MGVPRRVIDADGDQEAASHRPDDVCNLRAQSLSMTARVTNDTERVYRMLVDLEDEADAPVSAFRIAEALAEAGQPVRSFRAAMSRLCGDRRVWVAGVENAGHNRRHVRVYTARVERRVGRQTGESAPPLRIPAELRRAVRDVTAAVRATAEALARLDEIVDAGVAGATREDVKEIERRERLRRVSQRIEEWLPRRLND